jgi:ferrous iron transport protein A
MNSETFTLDMARHPSRLEVVTVSGGRSAVHQLAELGIAVGTQLAVCGSAPWGGPVLVEVGGSTVAVGRGIARKVVVKLLP